jgi:hypothetical protein
MFRSTAPDTEPAPVVVSDELIPLSVLALDLPEPPAGGWHAYLTGRGIAIIVDDVGRRSISRADARQLLDEQREAEARAREVAARQEQQAIEADQRFRAQLNRGTPWYEIPAGVSPAEAWAAAEKAAQPKRKTLLEESLAGEAMTFHSIGPDGDAS